MRKPGAKTQRMKARRVRDDDSDLGEIWKKYRMETISNKSVTSTERR